jgi:ABC-type transport system involved in multi-copper enzyme maturation permease subunit
MDTDAARPGFRQAVTAEWTKLRTVRSTVLALVIGTALVPALAVFVGVTRSLQPEDTVLGGSLTGAIAVQIAAAVVGVLGMAGEYGSGTIRATLAASPRRHTVLAAKATVTSAVTFVAGLAGCALAAAIGGLILAGKGYAPGEPMPALLGVAVIVAAVGVLGLAAGVILRSSAGASTTVIAILLLPPLLGPLFGDWGRWVVGASPATVLQKLSQSSDAAPDVAGSLGAWASLWLVCGYTAVVLAAGAWMLRVRDA